MSRPFSPFNFSLPSGDNIMVNFYLINFLLASTAILSAIVALGLFVYVIYNHPDSVVTRNQRNAQISDIRSQIPMESMGLERMSRPLRQTEYGFETIEQPSTSTIDYSSYDTIEPLAEKIIVHPECHSLTENAEEKIKITNKTDKIS